MDNYFAFFDLSPAFVLDGALLKQRFYENSRRYHPDFYTLDSAEAQEEALRLSTLNNEAYRTLADADSRMAHLLRLKGILGEEGQNDVPQDFLMAVMDINEAIMELEFDNDAQSHAKAKALAQDLQNQMDAEALPLLANYDDGQAQAHILQAAKDYYLKKRYLLRILENLNNFAPH